MEMQYDLAVIGAGPGGYEAAIEAAKKGMKVVLVEQGHLGGTCLNRGCIPTKTMLHTAKLYHELKKGENTGILAEKISFNMEVLGKRKDEVLEQMRKGIETLMKMNHITVCKGTAQILDRGRIKVSATEEKKADSVLLEASHILIATGSVASCPPIPGSDLPGVTTSDILLEKQEIFDHLIIIGGGVIGMEFASIYSCFGKKVTVLESMDRILPGMDREISQNLKMILKKQGVEIHTKALAEEIRQTEKGNGLVCFYREGDALCQAEAEGILICTGRKAFTKGLITEESSSEVRSLKMEKGHIAVNRFYETSIPGIYAIGDVTGGLQLAHAATAQGRNAVAHMAGEEMKINTSLIPSCVYTNPEIASVGMSADQAKAEGISVITKKYIMSANGKSILSQQERGFVKIVADSQNHRILGAQLMCARATDLISQLTMAIDKGLTLEDVSSVVFPHPTYSEGILEAVR